MKLLFSALAASCLAGSVHAADATHPAVVELFQSQGCSSCPPANAQVLAIAGRPDVLALSWEVTYWDYLGWTDTFGDRAFTKRQYDYAGSGHTSGVFTPQVVVNGRVDGVGDRADELAALLRQGDRGTAGPAITITDTEVRVGAGAGPADVVLVRYDPRVIQVPVHRGENAGVTLPHRNVVRQVAMLGEWSGAAASFALPVAGSDGLKVAVLVQAGHTGPILAAATK